MLITLVVLNLRRIWCRVYLILFCRCANADIYVMISVICKSVWIPILILILLIIIMHLKTFWCHSEGSGYYSFAKKRDLEERKSNWFDRLTVKNLFTFSFLQYCACCKFPWWFTLDIHGELHVTNLLVNFVP